MRSRFGVSLFLAVLLLLTQIVAVEAASNPNPGVLPPNSNSFGKTYGEWSAAWWQWAYGQPADKNPLFDETGEKCGEGQSGNVWFLAGVFNATGSATRTDCIIPAGKALFFPILNAECDNFWPAPVNPPMSVAQLREQCKGLIDPAYDMRVEIDGVSIKSLESNQSQSYSSPYRVISPVFSVQLPANNIQNSEPGIYSPLVGDGVYLMLHPLSAGKHTLHFHGSVPGFTLDITYDPLTVK